MLLPTSDAFMRTCLSCGLVEDFELSQQKQQVDPWEGWLRAEVQPLSWPHCVQYSETYEPTPVKAATGDREFFSYRPNVQTSFQNEAQREVRYYLSSQTISMNMLIRLDRETLTSTLIYPRAPVFDYWNYPPAAGSTHSAGGFSRYRGSKKHVLHIQPCHILGQMIGVMPHLRI